MNPCRLGSAATKTAAAIVVVTMLSLGAAATPGNAAAARPNVLIIVTDDQRTGMLKVMPSTVHWFWRGGMTFTRAYVATPLCCPSRASIFTGQYAHNHGVKDNSKHTGALPQDLTLQRYLSDGGYTTAIVGKYLNSWRVRRNPPHFHRWATVRGNSYANARFNLDGTFSTVDGYVTNVIATRAVHVLRSFERSDSQPWFLYIAPTAPHRPSTPAPQYAGTAVPEWTLDPAVAEVDRTDKPIWVRDRRTPLAKLHAHRADQLRTLMSVDDLVGEVFETLGSLRERRRTIAFFLSDNGYLWGEHGLASKRQPYTGSIKIPLLMRWPGHVPPHSLDRRLASTVDIAPTILDAANIAPVAPMDGRSLLRTWRRKHLFIESFKDKQYQWIPEWESIRTERFQYVEYYTDDRSSIIFREYYRLDRDPWQLTNVLNDADPANDPPVGWLHRLLQLNRACSGSSCP